MNGKTKFHKPNGPAFNVGEIWYGISTKAEVEIIRVEKFGSDKWDYEVFYMDESDNIYHKDAWNFQIRYEHHADLFV